MTNLVFWALVCFGWRANTETNLAGYKLYHGVVPGIYTNSVFIATPRTNACVTVPRGFTNYYVLTAVDTAGIESYPTVELRTTNAAPVVRMVLEGSADLVGWAGISNLTFQISETNAGAARFFRGRMEFW